MLLAKQSEVPEDLQWCQNSGQDVGHAGHRSEGAQRDGKSPRKAQQHVLHYCTVVVRLVEDTEKNTQLYLT